ncbi:MAG: response regulator [Candidatus Omnitrophica bacterium]|nr:response regulator [Candidatus Omnitrophota bacterium]
MPEKKILIIDDDPDILMVLEQRLAVCGYEVIKAKDGEEACAKVKAIKPDLIIMDVLMPKMTGYDALRKIRDDANVRHIPAIIISARGSMKDFFADFDKVEFVPKPYDAQVLLSKVHRFLDAGGPKVPVPPAAVPSAAAISPPPSPAPVRRRAMVVLGVQDGLTEKILTTVRSMGVEVDRALNEEDACKVAQKMRADMILCQYWEDDKILDAKKVAGRFLGSPALASVAFYVFCEDRSSLEVMKLFREDKIISYQQSSDLLAKVKNLLGTPA